MKVMYKPKKEDVIKLQKFIMLKEKQKDNGKRNI